MYLTAGQRQKLDEIAAAEGTTMAKVIRRALDSYLDTQITDPTMSPAATFGALPELAPPDRGEWNRG